MDQELAFWQAGQGFFVVQGSDALLLSVCSVVIRIPRVFDRHQIESQSLLYGQSRWNVNPFQ